MGLPTSTFLLVLTGLSTLFVQRLDLWRKRAYSAADPPTGVLLQPVELNIHGEQQGFIAEDRPQFRWRLSCRGCRNVQQVAFRVQVHGPDGDQLLDTGRLMSSALEYQPAVAIFGVQSDRNYKWQLTVWASAAGALNISGSAEGSFRTALLRAADWGDAQWIGGGTSFRSEFKLATRKKIAAAAVYVSGVGCYELHINGHKVTPGVFMEPSWVNIPNVRMHYRAYDVRHLLIDSAANAVGLRTGMCKFGYLGQHCQGAAGGWTSRCRAVILSLSVRYTDNTMQRVYTSASSNSWMVTTEGDPIRYSHLFHGEIYDAQLEDKGWIMPHYRPSKTWSPAVVYKDAAFEFGFLSLVQQPPIAISQSFAPVDIRFVNVSSGPAFVFDFGKAMAGFATLRVLGSPAGTKITLKYAEVLKGDGTVNMAFCPGEGATCRVGPNDGNFANQTDLYITGGQTEEEFTPHFTYHGFRYVQVEGLPAGVSLYNVLTAHFVHTNVSATGDVHFERQSMQILNQIQEAIKYTQLSNMHHHPTDCPQREKRGWMGDSQITSREATLNFDTALFYKTWVTSISDAQRESCHSPGHMHGSTTLEQSLQCCDPKVPQFGCDYRGVTDNFTNSWGSVPDVVPFHRPYGGWPGDPSWGAASVVIPWELHTIQGMPISNEMYDTAKGFVEFLSMHGDTAAGGVVSFGYYGDWLALPGGAPAVQQVTGWSHLLCVKHLIDLAKATRRSQDVEKYTNMFANLSHAYHARYWSPQDNSYGPSQTANLLPLYLDIVPPSLYKKVVDAFVASIEGAKRKVKSGIIGAAYTLQTLQKIGRGDLALSMATATAQPSWGHMVLSGPGTIWETWDDSTSSHNHPALAASIGPYLYSLAGLSSYTWGEDKHQRVRFALDSSTAREIGASSVYITRMAGPSAFSWTFQGNSFVLNATIAHGEFGELLMPASQDVDECFTLHHGSHMIWSYCHIDCNINSDSYASLGVIDVFRLEQSPGTVAVVVGSGEHQLKRVSSNHKTAVLAEDCDHVAASLHF